MIYQEYHIANEFDQIKHHLNESDSCKALFYDMRCFQYGYTCDSTGGDLKMCFESCERYYRACSRNMDEASILSTCRDFSAPHGTECFRSYGVLQAPFICPQNSTSMGKPTRPFHCSCNTGFHGKDGICYECPLNSNSTLGSTALAGCLCKPGYGS